MHLSVRVPLRLALGLTCCWLCLSCSRNQPDPEPAPIISHNGHYILVFKADSTRSTEELKADLLNKYQLPARASAHSYSHVYQGFSAAFTPEEIQQLRKDPSLQIVEADQGVDGSGAAETAGTEAFAGVLGTDETMAQITSWGATKVGIGNGAAVSRTAWIVDSGIQLDHPDLTIDIARSRSFISTSTSPADQFGHGTMVAGIIGARNNTFGVVGVAAGAKLASLRVMNATGSGTTSSVISALNYVASVGAAGDVVNLSLAASPSLAVDNAVLAVANKGIFIVIAAGNSSANVINYSPARVNHLNVFTVTGLRPDGTFMGISNFGSPTADYCAPGTGLQTTKMGSTYGSAGGTSMAAPHVAAILLLKGRNILTQGYVLNDPDKIADPIPKL